VGAIVCPRPVSSLAVSVIACPIGGWLISSISDRTVWEQIKHCSFLAANHRIYYQNR
jgi:hypothetical protein